MTFKDGGRRKPAQRQQLTIFAAREKKPTGVNWRKLDSVEIRAALSVAVAKGVTISFTPAAGGAGVMVKVYQGEFGASEFADSIEAVNELLAMIVDTYQSSSEDVRLAMGGKARIEEAAAD